VTPIDVERLVRTALHEVAPDADVTQLAADASLRETLGLDSLDFLQLVSCSASVPGTADRRGLPRIALAARSRSLATGPRWVSRTDGVLTNVHCDQYGGTAQELPLQGRPARHRPRGAVASSSAPRSQRIGKTTTIRLLAGLLKAERRANRVCGFDCVTTGSGRSGIGYLPGDFVSFARTCR
jgi:hypothetical protein